MKFHSHRLCARPGSLCAVLLLFAAWPAAAQRIEHEGLIYDAISPVNAALAEQLAPLQQSRGMRFLDWLGDGSMLLALRGEDTEQLHRVQTPLGTPEPLGMAGSDARESVVAALAQPYQSDALAVLRQAPGREPALLRLPLEGGEARELLGADWRPDHPLWAHDGQRLAVSASLRGQGHDVFLIDSGTSDVPRQLATEPGDWQAMEWSLDDRFLLLARRTPQGNSQLQWLDVASGERRILVDLPADERLQDARIAPDGRAVTYLAGSDWLRLQSLSLDGRTTRALTPAMRRNVEHYAISGDGRWLAFSYNDNGWSRLMLLDQQLSAERAIVSLPAGVITALQFDRSGTRLAINTESTASPPDVFVLDVASNAVVRWTAASAGPLGAHPLSDPQPVLFRSWQPTGSTAQMAALVYRPQHPAASAGAAAPIGARASESGGPGSRLPVLIYLAGEDEQPRPRFDPLLRSLVAVGGFAVIVPQMRQRVQKNDEKYDAVRDIGSLLIWISAQPDLDSTHVSIIGSGRRSAIALGALALFSDRLHRGAIIDGDANGVPLLAIERPVLIARGFLQPTLSAAAGDQLLWRLRAARSRAALFGPAGVEQMEGSGTQRAELTRVVLDFLTEGRFAAGG